MATRAEQILAKAKDISREQEERLRIDQAEAKSEQERVDSEKLGIDRENEANALRSASKVVSIFKELNLKISESSLGIWWSTDELKIRLTFKDGGWIGADFVPKTYLSFDYTQISFFGLAFGEHKYRVIIYENKNPGLFIWKIEDKVKRVRILDNLENLIAQAIAYPNKPIPEMDNDEQSMSYFTGDIFPN